VRGPRARGRASARRRPADRGASASAGHRPQDGPAAGLPSPEAADRQRPGSGGCAHRRQGARRPLLALLQRHRCRPLRALRGPGRDAGLLRVVEEPNDLMAMERTGEYRGRYHVLLGALSPLDGIGPDELNVRELLARVEGNHVREVILATNPNVEGDATALYL